MDTYNPSRGDLQDTMHSMKENGWISNFCNKKGDLLILHSRELVEVC